MTLLAPAWLALGIAGAMIVVGLHLFTRARPKVRLFPTARFIPEASLRTRSRTSRPTDLLLLALRALALLLIGVALARPVLTPSRKALAVIALADASPAADSVQVNARLALQTPAPDTVIRMADLSSGLIAARRAVTLLGHRADSVDLVIVSSLATGVWDEGTAAIRKSWPGRIRIQPVSSRGLSAPMAETDAGATDAVRAALERLGRRADRGAVLVRRGIVTRSDSTRAANGGVLVHWPVVVGARDTAHAVYAGGIALVGPLPKITIPAGDQIAQFENGDPAVVERALGKGCLRDVGFSLEAGDGLLRAAGLRLVERLLAPCGAGWTPDSYAPLDSARLAVLAGSGPLASPANLPDDRPRSPAGAPLLAAIVALAAERIVRRKDAA